MMTDLSWLLPVILHFLNNSISFYKFSLILVTMLFYKILMWILFIGLWQILNTFLK